jgi:hypothetical protein
MQIQPNSPAESNLEVAFNIRASSFPVLCGYFPSRTVDTIIGMVYENQGCFNQDLVPENLQPSFKGNSYTQLGIEQEAVFALRSGLQKNEQTLRSDNFINFLDSPIMNKQFYLSGTPDFYAVKSEHFLPDFLKLHGDIVHTTTSDKLGTILEKNPKGIILEYKYLQGVKNTEDLDYEIEAYTPQCMAYSYLAGNMPAFLWIHHPNYTHIDNQMDYSLVSCGCEDLSNEWIKITDAVRANINLINQSLNSADGPFSALQNLKDAERDLQKKSNVLINLKDVYKTLLVQKETDMSACLLDQFWKKSTVAAPMRLTDKGRQFLEEQDNSLQLYKMGQPTVRYTWKK